MPKKLLVALVLVAATALALPDTTLHPTPPPFPDATPDPAGPAPTDVHPGYMHASTANPYDDADLILTFNDPAALGTDSSSNGWNMTEVNSPKAVGGGLTYAANLDAAQPEYATVADAAWNSLGAGISWGVAGWIKPDAVDVRVPFSKGIVTATGEWDAYFSLSGNWNCRMHNGALMEDQVATFPAADTRVFVHCRFNATTDLLEAGYDATWSGTPTGAADAGDAATAMAIGAHSDASAPMDGTIGPVWWYRSASGGDVLTDAYTTSLYNSGKGKTCADTTETTNLVECWDMTPSGGPYVGTVNGYTLTGVNTPGTAAGLVNNSTTGMGFDATSGHTGCLRDLTGARWDFNYNTDRSVLVWYIVYSTNANSNKVLHFDYSTNSTFGGTANANNQRPACTALDSVPAARQANWGSDVSFSEWHMMTCSYNGTTHKVELTVDGGAVVESPALVGDFVGAGDITSHDVPNLVDGLRRQGAIDNYAVWKDRRLTTAEIADLWAAGAGRFYTAIWDFLSAPPHFAWSQKPRLRRVS